MEAPEEFINNLILSVRSLIPVEQLCEEVEKRNRLKLLNPFLEHLVSEGEPCCPISYYYYYYYISAPAPAAWHQSCNCVVERIVGLFLQPGLVSGPVHCTVHCVLDFQRCHQEDPEVLRRSSRIAVGSMQHF